jgi:uncharacterized protein
MPGHGRGRRRCRGRRRGRRWVEQPFEPQRFQPQYGQEPIKQVILSIEELEILRLIEIENLTQEEAAAMMGVSRKTLWKDLHKVRKKVAEALVNGYTIHVEGGDYIQRK